MDWFYKRLSKVKGNIKVTAMPPSDVVSTADVLPSMVDMVLKPLLHS